MKKFSANSGMFRVAHASRMLVSASRRKDLSPSRDFRKCGALRKSSRSRDALASTRDACATQKTVAIRKSSLALVLILAAVVRTLALTPGDLSRVKFDQHPGLHISRDLVFRNEIGRTVQLGDFFGKRPVILVLGYYRCPMLCTMINDGLINALENLRANVGADFDVVELSIDANETPAAAAERKALYVRRYGRSGAAAGWHCLVGDAQAITELTDELGYRYAYDVQIKQYAHPSGIIVLTPDGKISRYIFGVTFNSTELRDALAAAKEGQSRSVFSQIFLLCYHYNPVTGKYGALILSVLRVASVGTVISLILFVARMIERDRRSRRLIRAQSLSSRGLPQLRDP